MLRELWKINDKINHVSFNSYRKPETAEHQKPQVSSGVSDVPPRRLAATLSRLDIRWWRSNKAVWQLLSFFSSRLKSTLRGTNEKLAGEQKRSHHMSTIAQRARGRNRPVQCFFWHGTDGSAQAAPGKCHISTPRMEVSLIGYYPTLRSSLGQMLLQKDEISSHPSEDRKVPGDGEHGRPHLHFPHPGCCSWWPWWAQIHVHAPQYSIRVVKNFLFLSIVRCHSPTRWFWDVSKTEQTLNKSPTI